MATYYSQGSGNWTTTTLWDTVRGGGGSDPASFADMDDDIFVIQPGHTVTLDGDMGGWTNGLAGLTIEGHATGTPGMLIAKYDADGTYCLKIKTAIAVVGTALANKGRILANSDGVWGNTGVLPFGRKFIIQLVGTAWVDISNLDIALYCTEPTNKWVQTYGAKATVTVSGSPKVFTWTGHSLSANQAVMFSSTGTLPEPLQADCAYYVRSISGDTFRISRNHGDSLLVTLTTDGTGTLTCYTGAANGTTAFNVVEDVSADPQWLSGVSVALTNDFLSSAAGYDQQRTTINGAPSSTVVTLTAAADSAQCPFARIWLTERNVAIRSNTTTSTSLLGPSAGAIGSVTINCEVRSTAGTGTTFYGQVYGLVDTNMGGVYSGLNYASRSCAGLLMSGIIVACNSGFYRGNDTIVSGHVAGCTSGVSNSQGIKVTGRIANCTNAFASVSNCLLAGSALGCGLFVYSATRVTIRGRCVGSPQLFIYCSELLVDSGAVLLSTNAGTGGPLQFVFAIASSDVRALGALVRGGVTFLDGPVLGSQSATAAAPFDQYVRFEDYLNTLGAHRTAWTFGDVIKNDSVVRSGGAASSLEVIPYSLCGSALASSLRECRIPIFEWTETDVPTNSQTRSIYVRGENWTDFPDSNELWFEAEYYSAAGLTKTIVESTQDLAANNVWTQLSVSFTPAVTGAVRYRAYLAKYESGAKVYVDAQLN